MTENGTLSTNGRFYEKPHNRPEDEGAARYPEGNPRPNTTLYQAHPPTAKEIAAIAFQKC